MHVNKDLQGLAEEWADQFTSKNEKPRSDLRISKTQHCYNFGYKHGKLISRNLFRDSEVRLARIAEPMTVENIYLHTCFQKAFFIQQTPILDVWQSEMGSNELL